MYSEKFNPNTETVQFILQIAYIAKEIDFFFCFYSPTCWKTLCNGDTAEGAVVSVSWVFV